ncbi:low-density lipoprotein receptor-like [Mytilus californianus]|uniref:low-density lipoprotein receptor-like n=1 Tax=Mytilus californianus TaxID=6549 RepID=UPI0022482719|nr:low-density lipoprotein receptor-like [Mytilus californianus]
MKIRISFLAIAFISITTYNVTEATCAANEFQCDDGACIQSVYRCDDSFECTDRSDELNCVVAPHCVEGLQRCIQGNVLLTSPIALWKHPKYRHQQQDHKNNHQMTLFLLG